MAAEQPDRVVWARAQRRLTQSLWAAFGLCLVTPGGVALVWQAVGPDEVGLDARSALLLGTAPLLAAGLCGAFRRMAARRWRRSVLLGGTILGGFVGLASLFPLTLTLHLTMLALITIGTTDARGTATLLLFAALLAVVGGLALAMAIQLLRAAISLDELPDAKT